MQERPTSPHIQIYRWQWTMIGSILHRASGVALSGIMLIFSIWLICVAIGGQSFQTINSILQSFIGQLGMFGATLAFVYHFLNGIRHLIWDNANGLELDTARNSGLFVFVGTVLISVFAWGVALIG